MQVFSEDRIRLCLLHDYTRLSITKKLADGDKTLSFQLPRNAEGVKHLRNEVYIVTQEDEFVLKEIGTSKKYMKYTAQLNLEELAGRQYSSFETVEKTVSECLTTALQGTGWKVGKCNVTKRRTIRKDNICTAIDIINQCISTYKCEVEYHSRQKTIDIYEQIGSDRGVYFMEAVNLRQPPSFTSSTTEFYTQLKPIGKNGLTINVDGKDYVENYSYSHKKLMKIWKDERYTVVSSLLEDAELKLAELCRPVVTYEADVIDLAKTSEEYRDILDYSLGDFVTLVSKTSGIKEKMRIVKITEYPKSPQDNTCQLSTAKKSFADMQEEVVQEAVEEATATAAANTKETVDSESDITSEEIGLAMQGVKTEILKDVSDTYLQKTAAQEVADGAAKAAAEETKKYMDKQLESYATEQKVTQDITAAQKEIMQKVSESYAKKESMTATVQEMRQEMSGLQLDVAEQLQQQDETVSGQLAKQQQDMEKTLQAFEEGKNDITADDGTVWRMGIAAGCLYFEQTEVKE